MVAFYKGQRMTAPYSKYSLTKYNKDDIRVFDIYATHFVDKLKLGRAGKQIAILKDKEWIWVWKISGGKVKVWWEE